MLDPECFLFLCIAFTIYHTSVLICITSNKTDFLNVRAGERVLFLLMYLYDITTFLDVQNITEYEPSYLISTLNPISEPCPFQRNFST